MALSPNIDGQRVSEETGLVSCNPQCFEKRCPSSGLNSLTMFTPATIARLRVPVRSPCAIGLYAEGYHDVLIMALP